MTLDQHIASLVAAAVAEAAERASRSKEVMNPEEARQFLGLSVDGFKKRRGLIPCRRESERKVYFLRSDLLEYISSLPKETESLPDYSSDYPPHLNALRGAKARRENA